MTVPNRQAHHPEANELAAVHLVHDPSPMKKTGSRKALELKLKQIRMLTSRELEVPVGGLPTDYMGAGCPLGSGCGCTLTTPP
jgi:hypothetical protein